MEIIHKAIEVATAAHRNQERKMTGMPYISHPYSVGMILSQAGCSEQAIAAGILHDTVEDTELSLKDIEKQFGKEISAIVKGCTELDKKLPWEERKQIKIDSLATASLDVRLVVCADKLHNLKTIVKDLQEIGEQIWQRFKRGKDKQQWYYTEVLKKLAMHPEFDKYPIFKELGNEINGLFNVDL